jgi:hypothetical protein
MSDQGVGSEAGKAIGGPLGPIVTLGLRLLPEGPLQTLLYVVIVLCVALWPFVNKYYLGVLAQGAKPVGSVERQDYDKLRAGLAGDNLATRLYTKWLTAFLNGVERFFGDAGMADRTLLPRAFGLKTPVPLWTAPALDRCVLLALIYPVVTIFLNWTISGHVGPAEKALLLSPYLSGWSRGLIAAASFGFASFAIWRALRSPGWKSLALINVAVAVAAIVTVTVTVTVTDTVADAIAITIATAIAIAGAFAIAVASAGGAGAFAAVVAVVGYGGVVGTFAGVVFLGAGADAFGFAAAAIVPGAFAVRGAVAVIVAVAVWALVAFNFARAVGVGVIFAGAGAGAAAVAIGVAVVNDKAIAHRRQGIFLTLFLATMFLLCLGAADLLSPIRPGWKIGGPLLLFLGLLTFLNAPFDWASLGLTRALLRRGLELGGWWPYLLAILDAVLAGVIVALLALTMVIGVQAFDELAAHGGGEKAMVLPLDALFDGIAKNPGAPEYWWAYALLVSTMIPSLINLAIGGMAFTRGIPGVSRLLLNWTPEGREVPDYRRPLAALVLTGQMFAGTFLGIAAQAFLAWGLIFHVMPWVGLDLLDVARAVAAIDVPLRAYQLFAGIL